MRGTVLVSGGSGYIAGYLIRQLVEQGWNVHTTIRDLGKETEVRRLLNVDDSRLKFFQADLNHDAGWDEAMAGSSHVAHVASPLPGGRIKHPNELINPARNGVLRALRAAKAAGVKRFVLTSSVAAVANGKMRGVHTFTEADWTQPDRPDVTAYARSKTMAERAARDWIAKEGDGMEFCSVNPVVVIGPVWSADYSPSVSTVQRLLDGTQRGCPDLGFGFVDVRDVADLHVRALTAPGMAGERFIASSTFLKMGDVARILKERLGDDARKVSTRPVPNLLVRIAALFNPLLKEYVGYLGTVRNFDASHAKSVLGWQTRLITESIVDTAKSLIEIGQVHGVKPANISVSGATASESVL